MLKYTALALLTLFTSTYSSPITLTCEDYKVCEITGNSSQIIIASNKVPVLIVTCINCKKNIGKDNGILIYSSANYTYINCDSEDACEDTTLNFGITPPKSLPTNYDVSRKAVVISCVSKQSCKSMTINTLNNIEKGLKLVTASSEDATGSFIDGIINCGNTNLCELNCGINEIQDTCYNANCYGKGCKCIPNNLDTSCPENFNIRPTQEPTKNPVKAEVVVPTQRPTPEPTNRRNDTGCDGNGCILEPENDFDVFCGKQFNECNVKCELENQCANGVIIEANSKVVNIECSAINSCDKVKIISTEANIVNILLTGDTSGENMLIIAENEAATINIIASGENSFTNGQLFCDAQCNLNCGSTKLAACENTIYECLTTSDSCQCSGVCPLISKFGDQSCAGLNDCIITPDGSSRIVALNNVNTLTIDCTQTQEQCKSSDTGLLIYTAAKQTIIKCNSPSACIGMSVISGDIKGKYIPKGFKSSQFKVNLGLNEKQLITIDCDNENSCQNSLIYGTKHSNINILSNGEETLRDTKLICDNCESLQFECLNYIGCQNTVVKCSNIKNCHCNDVFVNITEPDNVIQNTCPVISGIVKRESIAAVDVQGNDSKSNGVKLVKIIAIVIGASLVVLLIGFMLIKCGKGYQKINDSKFDGLVAVNNNQHSLNGFQVEMN